MSASPIDFPSDAYRWRAMVASAANDAERAYELRTFPESYIDPYDAPYDPAGEGFGFVQPRPIPRGTKPQARHLQTRAGRRTVGQRLRALLPRLDVRGITDGLLP